MTAPAHVITAGLDNGLNADIRAWFRQFNFMPPLPLQAAQVDTLVGEKASLAGLLETMAGSAQRNFILIVHGHSDGSGLFLKIAPGQSGREAHTTHHDLQRLLDLDAGGPALSAADARTMGVSPARAKRLLELRSKLLAKGVDCIEFRACNLGRNPLSLDRFRKFLGARRAGAPDIHSFFGTGNVYLGQRFLERHLDNHRGKGWETYQFPSQWKTPELVWCFQLNHISKPESSGHVATSSAVVLNAWIRQHIMATGSYTSGGLPTHGLWIADFIAKPLVPGGKPRQLPVHIPLSREERDNPLGGWGGPTLRRVIPPLDPEYAKHIVYAR